MTPISWNTDVEDLPDGRRRHEVSTRRWKNYRKQNSIWQKIDTSIQSDRTVSKFSLDAQFPVNAQDWVNLVFNSSFSPKRKLIDNVGNNSEPDFLLDVTAETQHNATGVVGFEDNPSWMGYPESWDGVDLIYEVNQNAACRLKKLLRFNAEPAGTSEFIEYNFILRSSHAKIFIGDDRDVRPWDGSPGDTSELFHADAWVARSQGTDDSEIRGTTVETPSCWYTSSSGEVIRSDVKVGFSIISQDGETVRATKFIPRSMVQAAMAEGVSLFADTTFRTDDVGAVGSDHASYWTGNATWATARGANGTAWNDSYFGWFNYMISMSSTTNQYDDIRRIFLFFDTSALTGSVTDADLTWNPWSQSDTIPLLSDTNVYGSTSTGTTSGAISDYQTFQTTPFSSGLAWNPTGLQTMVLNTSGKTNINVNGFSRFCLAFANDIEDFEPMWSSGGEASGGVKFSEYTGDNGPQLIVTTSAPAAAGLLQATNSYMRRK